MRFGRGGDGRVGADRLPGRRDLAVGDRVPDHAGEGGDGERQDQREGGQRGGERGPGGAGQAEERGRAAGAGREAEQPAQNERVEPQHDDHDRDGDEHRRGAGVEVDAGPGLAALVAEHDDARHRGGDQHHLDDQPPPGPDLPPVGDPALGQAVLPGRDQGGTEDGDDQHGDRRPPAARRSRALDRAGPGDGEDGQDDPEHGRGNADERGSGRGAEEDLPQRRAARPDHRELASPAHRDHPARQQQHRQAGDRQAHVEQPQ